MIKTTFVFVALMGVGLAQDPWDAVKRTVQVDVRARVLVRGTDVRLSDVADLHGIDAAVVARVGGVPVTSVPDAGDMKLIRRDSLEAAAARALPESITVRWSGASEVHVEAETVALSGEEVGTLARRWVYAQFEYGDTAACIVPAKTPPPLTCRAGRYSTRFEVVPAGTPGSLAGLVRLEVRAIIDGVLGTSVPVALVIKRPHTVVVVARRVQEGRPLDGDDIRLEERLADGSSPEALTSIQQTQGMLTRRALEPGTIVSKRDLKGRPVLRRYDAVTVRLLCGGLTISSPGKTLAAGAPGEVIPVETGPGRRVVQARVIDSETVEVGLDSAGDER
jgi:flagella basal body P-ring formation protein FlgA